MTQVILSRKTNSRVFASISTAMCWVLALMVMACASVPQTPEKIPASADRPKTTPSIHPTDATAAYHFMLGYQAELAQDMERAIQEYQAALKADPASQSVKARLASLYFSLGDMPNAERYADQAAEGLSQDGQLLTQMAGILASVGQGERAVKLLDRAIELDQTSGDPYFTKGAVAPESETTARGRRGNSGRIGAGSRICRRILSLGTHTLRCRERGGGRSEFGASDCRECLV